jgi:glycosyltransferase involved in cell wall biosynthesis
MVSIAGGGGAACRVGRPSLASDDARLAPESAHEAGSDPLVSVIVIFLNAERFLEEAIESVYAQTYTQWELLLVDDGSTDSSTEIARRYARRDPGRVSYLTHPGQENRGMSASRNLGARHARGPYLCLLDADDVWLPRKLEEQTGIMKRHPAAGMVYGAGQHWHSWTRDRNDLARDRVPALGVRANASIAPPNLLLALTRGWGGIPPTSVVMVRREVFADVGGFEESFRGLFEDQVFFAKVYARFEVFVAGACWVRYRQHGASECAVAAREGRFKEGHTRFLRWLQEYLVTPDVRDRRVQRALSHELRYHDDPTALSWPRVERYLLRRGRKLWFRIMARGRRPEAVELGR